MSSQVTELRLPTWTLGDRLRKARELTGLQQKDFADAIGVDRNTVGNYERDRTNPQRTVLRAWASFCDVPFEWLTGQGLAGGDGDGGRHGNRLPRADSNGQPAGSRSLTLSDGHDFRSTGAPRTDELLDCSLLAA